MNEIFNKALLDWKVLITYEIRHRTHHDFLDKIVKNIIRQVKEKRRELSCPLDVMEVEVDDDPDRDNGFFDLRVAAWYYDDFCNHYEELRAKYKVMIPLLVKKLEKSYRKIKRWFYEDKGMVELYKIIGDND
nr:MAG: hypothetical protein [Lokiarchaeota virus Skoll Meg22_1214]